ncbi:MAG: DUF177 domain-containing protein [Eubacteriaceae bacterium]|nr:DUF177 domain-containing protein [Eubacteriaceae bacterium]
MIINISDLIKHHRSRMEFSKMIPREEISDEYLTVVSPVKAEGSISVVDEEILISFKVGVKVRLNCSRCLEVYDMDLDIDIKEAIDLNDNQNNSNENIDLTELIRDNILINLPIQTICSEDCKGLCNICGDNKNINECNCENEQIDPRLSVLNNLLNGDE